MEKKTSRKLARKGRLRSDETTSDKVSRRLATVRAKRWIGKIDQLMQARGWSQHTLSRMISVPQTTVSRWLLGAHIPAADHAKALASAFGVTLNDLFYDDLELPLVSAVSNSYIGDPASMQHINSAVNARAAQTAGARVPTYRTKDDKAAKARPTKKKSKAGGRTTRRKKSH